MAQPGRRVARASTKGRRAPTRGRTHWQCAAPLHRPATDQRQRRGGAISPPRL